MIEKHVLYTADCHIAGEPARILINGFPVLHGNTVLEKLRDFQQNYDYIRTGLMHEPRGFDGMFGVVLTEPTSADADIGAFFMDGRGYTYMCGHGTLCLGYAVASLGLANPREPSGKLIIETPAGLVTTFIHDRQVVMQNLPSFVYKSKVPVNIPTIGVLHVDIPFGGIFFSMVDSDELGLDLTPSNIPKLRKAALIIRGAVNRMITVKHPLLTSAAEIESVVIYGPPEYPKARQRNIDIFANGQFDRSPCGTATCARMATLYAEGELSLNEEFVNESIIGTTLVGRLVETTQVGDIDAVIPEISGEPYLIGLNHWIVEKSDPLHAGIAWNDFQ